METSPKQQNKDTLYLQTSPNSNSNSSSSSNAPLTPKPITRSETNTYPTTFVQADTCSFKQVVQMLTGSSETVLKQTPSSSSSSKTPSQTKTGPKKPGFKLYERRNSLKNIKISPLIPELVQKCGFSPRKQELLSPSMLDFPSLVLSPVTPLNTEPFNRYPLTPCTPSTGSSVMEERLKTPRDSEPRLLPLFPTTSTRITGSST